jgi:Na+(H+)/acetate symporter ActP
MGTTACEKELSVRAYLEEGQLGMLDRLRNEVYLPGMLIVLAFFLASGTVGLWYVRKTTGRPLREMLSLLVGAVVFILLMLPSFFIFHGWLESPDGGTRHTAARLLSLAYIPVALLVWWAFNKLAKPKRAKSQRPPG